MAKYEVNENVTNEIKNVVEETTAKSGINVGTCKAIALCLGLVGAAIGVGKLAAIGIKAYKDKHELKLAERGDFDDPEEADRDEDAE